MEDLNALSLEDLYRVLSREGWVTRLIELARDEDLGPSWALSGGDVTSRALVLPTARARGFLVARSGGVVSGLAIVPEVLHAFRVDADFVPARGVSDGTRVEPGTTIGTLVGAQRGILSAERTLLNFLGRLSGIATRTAEFVALAGGGGGRSRIFDTRKTTPGLRVLEKYAVRCGGGCMHRLGLYDAALIKDNHLAGVSLEDLPRVVERAVKLAKEEAPREGLRFIEVEVDSLAQLKRLLEAGTLAGGGSGGGVGVVLLDNFGVADVAAAVAARDAAGAKVELEASGGVTRETLPALAATGVDRISLGTLTHGATWLDVALDLEGQVRG
ncbi:MAG: carboxylating nicotinate-nucleotide diphosphorylase [Phycisphaerae bacterium]|nr:carboxylating nicotinate-nucleotide diphosphorylase [Phycisphaerae bacterium]